MTKWEGGKDQEAVISKLGPIFVSYIMTSYVFILKFGIHINAFVQTVDLSYGKQTD